VSNTTAMTSRHASLGKMTSHLPAAAKAAATTLALCLVALPGAHRADAQDIAPFSSSNAALVFSPVIFSTTQGDSAQMCAWNRGSATVHVTFVFEQTGSTAVGPIQQPHSSTIAPRHAACDFLTNVDALIGASIVLNSPAQCSQAADYPGKCGVIGALELFEGGETRQRVHLEPVLQPASPHLPVFTLPQ
jgi:hypothetical protein